MQENRPASISPAYNKYGSAWASAQAPKNATAAQVEIMKETQMACQTEVEQNWIKRGQEVLDIEIEGLEAVKKRLGPSFTEALSLLAACAGRVVVSGVGKSGLVGRKLAATFSSTGTPAFFLHPVEGQHGDLGSLRQEDVLIAISNSGRTDELLAILPALRSLGVKMIALTGGADSPLAQMADVVIDTAVPREACPLNLAPTSSTTAVLAVGDALAACLIDWKHFTESDFKRNHPGGNLGQRLKRRVGDLMHHKAPLCPAGVSLGQAARALNEGGFGVVLFTDENNRLTGLLTDGDLRRIICKEGFNPESPAAGLMTRSFSSVKPEQAVAEALDIMEAKSIMVLPVLGPSGEAAGVIHLHDVLGKGRIKFI